MDEQRFDDLSRVLGSRRGFLTSLAGLATGAAISFLGLDQEDAEAKKGGNGKKKGKKKGGKKRGGSARNESGGQPEKCKVCHCPPGNPDNCKVHEVGCPATGPEGHENHELDCIVGVDAGCADLGNGNCRNEDIGTCPGGLCEEDEDCDEDCVCLNKQCKKPAETCKGAPCDDDKDCDKISNGCVCEQPEVSGQTGGTPKRICVEKQPEVCEGACDVEKNDCPQLKSGNGDTVCVCRKEEQKSGSGGEDDGICKPCKPDPKETTCKNQCGEVENNCRQKVDCGACPQECTAEECETDEFCNELGGADCVCVFADASASTGGTQKRTCGKKDCQPSCEGRCGGDDGCGGECPDTCPEGEHCGSDNETCEPDNGCVPAPDPCGGKNCGSVKDSCGNTVRCGRKCKRKKRKKNKKRCFKASRAEGKRCNCNKQCKSRKCQDNHCCDPRGDGTQHCRSNSGCCGDSICAYIGGRRDDRVCVSPIVKAQFESQGITVEALPD